MAEVLPSRSNLLTRVSCLDCLQTWRGLARCFYLGTSLGSWLWAPLTTVAILASPCLSADQTPENKNAGSPSAGQTLKNKNTGLEIVAAVQASLVEAIATAEPSVVAIATVPHSARLPIPGLEADPFGIPFRNAQDNTPANPDFIPHEFGTGVIVDAQGLILTHYKLVSEDAHHWVTLPNHKVYKARIRAADPRSGLAILKIDAEALNPITLGDAQRLRKGQFVVSLGNPYAIARDGQASASWGIVSNLARKAAPLPIPGQRYPKKDTLHHFGTLIQTDAKLNLGTSGGALINLDGQMVGLTTSLAALPGYDSAAGYAIPINQTTRRVIELLKAGREVEYGVLGVSLENLRPSELSQGQQGSRVGYVHEATPAAWVGLRRGDIITHVDEQPVRDADQLMLQIGSRPAESSIRLTVASGEKVRQLQVQLAKYPVQGVKIFTQPRPTWRGLEIEHPSALPEAVHAKLTANRLIDREGCVAISKVAEGSPAWQAGLRRHMLISHVGHTRVRTPTDFRTAVVGQAGEVRLRLTLPETEQPIRMIAAP